jgi:putative endonuclease
MPAVRLYRGDAVSALSKLLQRTLNLRRKETERKELPRSARVGAWGEEQAAAYLSARGYTVLGRNVRPNRRDELDLVVRQGDTLVFVEVKTRHRETFARPARAVNPAKRHALNRAAVAYLRKARFPDLYYRFDVIEVLGQPEEGEPLIRHLENAFSFERRFVFPV